MQIMLLSSIPARLVLLLIAIVLPIPVRPQVLSGRNVDRDTPVLFPSSIVSCVACKPAFSSPACQVILNAIAQSSVTPIPNTTLASCQCSGIFLALYDTCVRCFKETNQLNQVFGSSRIPTLSSLESYCESVAPVLTMTIEAIPSPTTAVTPTLMDSSPSSGTALKVYREDQAASTVMMCAFVAAMTLTYFSIKT
ncbi:hypothetical protein B0O80DRAFT_509355 [Mortierella sp. GBAus27b]|nr:hypothetical protein B0O80DRAFT_509355 [Mortierella sp. GBAus27b]